jgi:hypothetical protein
MKVLLEIQEIRTYRLIFEDMDSIRQARDSFDPCEDLDEQIPISGHIEIIDAKEIFNCLTCEGKGKIKGKELSHNVFCGKECPECKGKGYFIPNPKMEVTHG